jgi:MOSC domain-containing protein YiiM
MAKITSIAYSPRSAVPHPPDAYQRLAQQAALLVEGHGIQGDRKGSSPKRQLNVMLAEELEQLALEGCQTAPGQMGEQLVLRGLNPQDLAPGTVLQLGATARIEVLKLRTGCDRFEHIQKRTPADVAGRLGVMARVVTGGPIAIGDTVAVLAHDSASAAAGGTASPQLAA